MKILHYSLGLPPFRTGGMTKYCIDLMSEQVKKGHDVSFIYPGELHNKRKGVKIKSHGEVKVNNYFIRDCFEVINPLPIPLLDGIKDVKLFEIEKDITIFNKFFNKYKFDIIHVHTFMGMPFEFLYAARSAKVKLVYTSHDYFSICPRGNLFNDGKNCIYDNECVDCIICNQKALSYAKMYLLQSNLYRILKDTKLIACLRKRHNSKLYSEKIEDSSQVLNKFNIDTNLKNSYQSMRQKNIEWLNKFDVVHFNSKNTLEVYKRYGKTMENSQVISISNKSILDHRKYRNVKGKVRFGYLGSKTIHKGYQLLKDSCDILWNKGVTDFELHIFCNTQDDMDYLIKHPPYKYHELDKVMDCFDVLIVPSLCNETFGFTALEALSFGIPVITTENVGAKDLIIDNKNGCIINGNIDELSNIMEKIINKPNELDMYNEWIMKNGNIKTMEQHSEEIILLYKKIFTSLE